jgi:hypothetical protein
MRPLNPNKKVRSTGVILVLREAAEINLAKNLP